MKVFLAGETAISRSAEYAPKMAKFMQYRLFSYHYHGMKDGKLTRDVKETRDIGAELFLDSGAFTAFTKGATIDLDKYAEFCVKHDDVFSVKANVDVIGDTGPASWDNLKYLEQSGAKVFPVFHYTDDDIWLSRILDEGYDFFALGGLVGASRKRLLEWLDRIWTKYLVNADGTPRAKVHGFGLTDQVLMLRYPWYSVDSASWIFSANFGSCVFAEGGGMRVVRFSSDNPDIKSLNSWHYDNLPPAQQAEVVKWLEGSGVTPEEVRESYLARFVVNARGYTRLGEYAPLTWRSQQETFF